MYKQCRTEQSAARQYHVELCFLRELEQKHYDDISVSGLCEQAGISRKSFYRYFSGKSGILHALLDHTILQMDALLPGRLLRPERPDLAAFFRFWQSNRDLLDSLDRSGLLGELTDRAVIVELDYLGRLSEPIGPERDRQRLLAEFLLAGIYRVMTTWYRDGCRQSPEELAALTAGILGNL